MANKQSPLSALLYGRLRHLEAVDKADFPERMVGDPALWSQTVPSLAAALKRKKAGGPPRVLAEVKRASPSKGALTGKSAVELARIFAKAGAAGLSVLADAPNFGGSPNDVRQCRTALPGKPILFKDFVTTPYQVYLARHVGASAVLLMTQVLGKDELRRLFDLAMSIGLEPFVEAHSLEEFDFALSLKPPLLGINARDFNTEGMPLDLMTGPRIFKERFAYVRPPENTVFVCQSGIEGAADIARLDKECPTGLPDAVQIGTSLSLSDGAWLRDYLDF